MKQCFTFFCIFLLSFSNYAQNPVITFQSNIGGDDWDIPKRIIKTSDGGYLMAGISKSNASFDKSEDAFDKDDAWIVKVDANGLLEWENTIGGFEREVILGAVESPEGGYIITGWTSSSLSGDIDEEILGISDAWIFKLDENGVMVWQQFYGGDNGEAAFAILALENGTYLVGGSSDSNISGEKTENSLGENDYWILIINEDGDILQQKTIGGGASEFLTTAIVADDGNYIIGGYSSSDASEFKSENSHGFNDYWVLKLDTDLNIIWENTIGGDHGDLLYEIVQGDDGGFLLAGKSLSEASGDKSENSIGGDNNVDYWAVKIDSNGVLEWENTIGGDSTDELYGAINSGLGGFYIGGTSPSDISADKSEDSNWIDIWLLHLDADTGEINWQETLGGDNTDYLRGNMVLNDDGSFTFAGYSSSFVSGDVTDGTNGGFDYWLVTMSALTLSSEENTLDTTFSVFPNPALDVLQLSAKDMIVDTIKIYSTKGILVQTIEGFSGTATIDVSQLSAGVYFLQITAENKTVTKKFIKE